MWQNWSGYVSCPDTRVLTPGSEAELADIVRQASRNNQPVRVVGGGHSFSPLVATDGVIVSLDALQGVVEIDKPAGIARVRAGTRLFALGAALAAEGLAMENLGDINVQSIAGATSTGTHGTGIGLGNIATQIVGLKFVDAEGREISASPTDNPDLFAGGRVALGSLGVLTELSLRLVPSFRLRLVRGKLSLDECLARADELIARNRSFEFYWLPHTDAVLTKAWNVTDEPVDQRGWQRYLSDVVLENMAFGALCRVGKAVPALCPPISRFCASLLSSSTQVDASWSMLSTVRQVRFNEMEWSVPAERGADALREIRALIARREFPLMFPLEYRWVRGDDIWLSPNHGRDSVHISVHQYVGMPWEPYFDAVQAICLTHGGRPHWGKVHSLAGPQLARLYPRWDDFLALRERMDPAGRFLTPYLRKLFGLGATAG
ncbi:D-arabinono-1,4-lactone oxidase [Aquabacterium sp.]|uniref:D-arabinono-1,4-lactone oxidase n=1 Tax=Aquabacterium sp. TaxID=1872578 RepID=UPI003782E3D5